MLAVGFALALETIMLRLRDRPVQPFLSDYSAVVTAVLFALCMPPLAPWWIALVGMIFAIVVAKHLYGGLGYNLFNPTMVGFAAVIIAFPMDLSQWLAPRQLSPGLPGLWQTAQAILTGSLPDTLAWDALSEATPLDALKTGVAENRLVTEIRDAPIFGDFGGLGWEWIANLYALGGLWLLYRRVISWHVPVAVLATVVIVSTPMWLAGPDINPSPAAAHFLRRAGARCIFHRHRPGLGLLDDEGPAVVRRRRRDSHPGHPPLRRLPRRRRLRRAADEHGRADDRPTDATADLRALKAKRRKSIVRASQMHGELLKR